MEIKLLKLCLNRDKFEKIQPIVSKYNLSSDVYSIYNNINNIYNKYNNITNISLEELKNVYYSVNELTTAQKQLIDTLFNRISTEEINNEELVYEVIEKLNIKEKQRYITELCIQGVNEGVDNTDKIRELLEEQIKKEDLFQPVSTDMEHLLEGLNYEFPIPVPSLVDYIPGLGRGNLCICFGRPEIGKSSLVGSIAAGYLREGFSVAYFGNEEPIRKICMNIVRAILNKSDNELRAENAKKKQTYQEWDAVRHKLTAIDAVGFNIDIVDKYARKNKPDIIILDQADKFSIDGQYAADHSKLKDIYIRTREIAKRNECLVWDISQASVDAHDKRQVTYEMLDGSKTGKAGEADLIIGIGKDAGVEENFQRYLTVSKNKINGWHGCVSTTFNPYHNQWAAV